MANCCHGNHSTFGCLICNMALYATMTMYGRGCDHVFEKALIHDQLSLEGEGKG